MKLAPCNKHKGDQNLICFKIRHDNGDEATPQEILTEIAAQKHRADALAAVIRELRDVVTHDAETKAEFVARCRAILSADPDARLTPNVEVRGGRLFARPASPQGWAAFSTERIMCKEIAILNKDGAAIFVNNKIEIEVALCGKAPGLEDSPDNGCLCPLDEDATAEKFGYIITNGWDTRYSCDLVMTPNAEITGSAPLRSPS